MALYTHAHVMHYKHMHTSCIIYTCTGEQSKHLQIVALYTHVQVSRANTCKLWHYIHMHRSAEQTPANQNNAMEHLSDTNFLLNLHFYSMPRLIALPNTILYSMPHVS